jgi:hypothetical protein
VFSFVLFFTNGILFYDFIFNKSEIRTVLLEVGSVLGLLKKKTLLKTSKIVLMYSNSRVTSLEQLSVAEFSGE